jgi:hypothetical protein
MLLKEFGAHMLGKSWLSAAVKFWNRMVAMPENSILKQAFLDNIHITQQLHDTNRQRISTWMHKFTSMLMSLSRFIPTDSIRAEGLVSDISNRCISASEPTALNLSLLMKAWDKLEASPWENLPRNPRLIGLNDMTSSIKISTYHSWFAVPIKSTTRTYRMRYWDLPRYILHTVGINTTQLSQLMKFRLGIHHLHIETGRRTRPKTPRNERLCSRCTWNVIEDEYHFIFQCPAYQHIRGRYESLFLCIGGHDICGSNTPDDLDMITFMDQNPSKLIMFLDECFIARNNMVNYIPYHNNILHLDLFDSESDQD